MKFSMEIPVGDVTPGEFQSMTAVREMAVALEQAGIDGCYVTDHPAPSSQWLHAGKLGHDALDPFAALSFVAATSTRLMLQTNIIVLPYRNPFITAKAATTVQILSGGRLILGTAPGYQKPEFEALGVDFHKRGVLMDEALETIRLAWAGGSVVKEGKNFNAAGNEPRPTPDPPPPIWIGGASDKAVERAARAGDGWCPFFADPRMSEVNRQSAVQSLAHLVARIDEIQHLRARFGRTGNFAVQIGPRTKLKFGSSGGIQEYLDEVAALAEAGVSWLAVATPHRDRTHYIENVQWFGEEIASRVATLQHPEK